MPRGAYKYYHQTNFSGGINQNPEEAQPNQVLDALNVWALNGRLEQRPGYRGLTVFGESISGGSANTTIITEDVSGPTFDAAANWTLSNFAAQSAGVAGDRWYVGRASNLVAFQPTAMSASNTNNVGFKAEYWNGTDWARLTVKEWSSSVLVFPHLSNAASSLVYVPPRDWATTSVNAITGTGATTQLYYLRFTLMSSDDLAFDAGVTMTAPSNGLSVQAGGAVGIAAIQFASCKRYLSYLSDNSGGYGLQTFNRASIEGLDDVPIADATNKVNNDPISVVIVAQFDEAYVSFGGRVYVHKAFPSLTDTLAAQVESDPLIIGTDGEYDPAVVAWLNEWPQAKYMLYMKDRLWAANLQDAPFTLYWSAPGDAYRVWPSTNFAFVAEDDNSPISGLSSLNENVIVFKSDSIWQMVDVGESEIGQIVYQPIKIVSGIGCVSNSSIVRTPMGLMFLAEDGVYLFDGTPNLHKISDAIDLKIATISAGRRAFASGAHWKTRNCYLLSVAVDGSEVNNLVLVYDYERQAWWFWDDMPAQCWMVDEDSFDDEQLYFGDSSGNVYQVGGTWTDHGATPEVYVRPHRFGANDVVTKTLREVRINADNADTSLIVDVYANDASSSAQGTLSLTDEAEAHYDEAVWNTDTWAADQRREKRLDYRVTGDWFQVKVSNTTKEMPLTLNRIAIGYEELGTR